MTYTDRGRLVGVGAQKKQKEIDNMESTEIDRFSGRQHLRARVSEPARIVTAPTLVPALVTIIKWLQGFSGFSYTELKENGSGCGSSPMDFTKWF